VPQPEFSGFGIFTPEPTETATMDLFCPQCGADLQPQQEACPKCAFPLLLRATPEARGWWIPPEEKKDWQKVLHLWQQSGIRLQETPQRTPFRSEALRLVFPLLGFLLFLSTWFFGDQWSSREGRSPSQTPASIEAAQPKSPDTVPPKNPEEPLSEVHSPLTLASDQEPPFPGPTEEQEAPVEESSWEAAPPAEMVFSREDILNGLASWLVKIEVGPQSGYGFLVSHQPLILSSTELFPETQTTTRTHLVENGVFKTARETIAPSLHYRQERDLPFRLKQRFEHPPACLVEMNMTTGPAPVLEFFLPLEEGMVLWLPEKKAGAAWALRDIQLQRRLEDAGILTFSSSDLRNNDPIGLPLFNEWGSIVAMTIAGSDGQKQLLDLLQIRERAPLIFRDIHRSQRQNP
jgi:hypothetical protein